MFSMKSFMKMMGLSISDADLKKIEVLIAHISKRQDAFIYLIDNFDDFVDGMVFFSKYTKELRKKELNKK